MRRLILILLMGLVLILNQGCKMQEVAPDLKKAPDNNLQPALPNPIATPIPTPTPIPETCGTHYLNGLWIGQAQGYRLEFNSDCTGYDEECGYTFTWSPEDFNGTNNFFIQTFGGLNIARCKAYNQAFNPNPRECNVNSFIDHDHMTYECNFQSSHELYERQ